MGGIYLEPEKIIKNAEEIAEKSKNDEKFVFRIQYESAARQVVLAEISRLDCEIINQSDSDSTVTVRISMPQLAAIKTLNCIEKVDTAEEIGTENTVNKKVLHNVEKYDTISIKTENEPDLSASVQMDTNSAIAPLCYGGGSSCIDNSNTMQTAHYLSLASWKEGCICCPCAEQWYRFTASIREADTYTIYTSGSLDTVGYLYDANGTLLASNDDSNGNRNFKITRQLTTGSRYYVKVKAFANNIGDYELRVDYTVRSSSCGGTSCDENKESASELVVNRWQSGEICCPCAVKWYKFTPQSSAYYTIYTVGSLDTVGALYDANDNLIKSNDDGGQGLNFKLVSYLTAGQTYYIKVNAFGNKTGRYSIAAISAVFVESVSITDPYITLNKGETAVLTTEVLPSYATNKSLWWQSGDNNIVTVSPEGVITAVDGGTTNVIATTRDSSGRSGCCTVTVNVPVESVKVNDERRIMYTGTTDRFEVTVCPHNATNKLVRWSSTNTNVATVDPATGKITAISVGTARIIATAQDGTGKSGACELTVKPAIPVEGVTIGSSTYTMKVGETTRLSYSVYPVDATNQRVTWCSSDPNVAEVGSRNRKITAKRAGKTTITVTTDDGNFVASCEVFVSYPDLFKDFITDNTLMLSDIKFTNDGFSITTVPLSTILTRNGIDGLSKNIDTDDNRNVTAFYDDWYIFAVETLTTFKYGLCKMREQEDDYVEDRSDFDDPGVTISFIALDENALVRCIKSPIKQNTYGLLQCLDKVTGPGVYTHDDDIVAYFADVKSKAAYLIAEEYIKIIVRLCNGNSIPVPNNYISILNNIDTINEQLKNPTLNDNIRLLMMEKRYNLSRVPRWIAENNQNAGYNVYDYDTKTISVANKNNLSIYEKYAILSTHTADVNFNSFAAEVEFHADAIHSWKTDIPMIGNKWYEAAVRADMAIGEEYESGFYDEYYDLDSDIVKAQAEVHGEY